MAWLEDVAVRPVANRADRTAFVELAYRINSGDPNWVPPLKGEVRALVDPAKNPWFQHAEAAFFLAERAGQPVGRISAQLDQLVLAPDAPGFGPGTGHWGMFEAQDAAAAEALLATAEGWLAERGMSRSMGPFSLSIWDEPGLLVEGHDHAPTIMMGHNRPEYQGWVEAAGYAKAKDLLTYDLDVTGGFGPLVERIVASGEKNPRIRIRTIDKRRFDEEARLILSILNDAWSGNWGFVPMTDAEIAYAGKKLKPIAFEGINRIAEVDGEPVAFMLTVPDLNELICDLHGELFPFGWAKLLWRLRNPRTRTMRVPLMGVVRRLQASRLASQLAFMMIEYNRREAVSRFGASRGEIGWILEDNGPMISIADVIRSKVNRVYRIYEKAL